MPRKKSTKQPAAKSAAPAPARRFARTMPNILVALGFRLCPENKHRLEDWRTFPDFPKKEKNGYDIAELKAFLSRHEWEFMEASKQAKKIGDGAKYTTADEKLLVQARNTSGTPAGGDLRAVANETEVMGMEGIARVLRDHFSVPVSKMDISDWARGKRLDHGVPNFPPPKASGRYNTLEAINWFRQWKFSDPRESATPDLFKRLENERAKSELERLDHERLLRSVERAAYLRVTEHNAILASIGNNYTANLWEQFDQRAYPALDDKLAALGMPEEWRTVAATAVRELNPALIQAHTDYIAGLVTDGKKPEPAENTPSHPS